jgi:hypothetical protein
MTGPDDEFDDFLARRRPVFRRPADDSLEPPPDLDRIVLRRAREAIESDEPEPLYHGPRWGMPVALAATVLLAVTVLLHVVSREPVPVVTVQNVAEHETTAAAPAAAPAAEAPDANSINPPVLARRDAVPGVPNGLVSREEATRYAAPAPPSPPVVASSSGTAGESTAQAPPADSARTAGSPSTPAFRRDTRSWLAEIERLRAEGKTAQADLEQAEFNREHRALAVAPDR